MPLRLLVPAVQTQALVWRQQEMDHCANEVAILAYVYDRKYARILSVNIWS